MRFQIYLMLIGVIEVFSDLTANCPPDSYFHVSKCSCSKGDVECRNINTWLRFPSTVVLNKLVIKQSPAFIIRNSTFNNLRVERLELSQNQLSNSKFESDSFHGLTVDDLILNGNNLTFIPTSIGKIKNLKGLDVSLNKIKTFSKSDHTMRILGNTLKRFTFGSQDIKEWPRELRHFPMLEELNVMGGSFTLMPGDSFYGFKKSLKKLRIQSTNLESVPLEIAELDFLTELRFDHNDLVGDYGMNIPIVENHLTHLGLMSLKDDDITTFPKIIGTFKNLSNVLLDQNNLEFVSDESADIVQRVTKLSLRRSNMTRIPGALQRIRSLVFLDLSENEIHSIDNRDLKNMTNLTEIKLNNNPILYVSSTAFENMKNLTNIELRNTNLTQIPCSLKSLDLDNKDIVVDLSNNKIECTCELQWFYAWKHNKNKHSIKVLGVCETINSSLEDYFKTLNVCPRSNLCP